MINSIVFGEVPLGTTIVAPHACGFKPPRGRLF